MPRETAVTPLDPSVLRLAFSDGLAGEIDCRFLLRGTLDEPLKDPAYFRQVRVDDELRTIVWPNGLDPAPELLRGEIEPTDAVAQRSVASSDASARSPTEHSWPWANNGALGSSG